MCNVKSTNISTGYKTDHSLIEIMIATHSYSRGPSFWKLNTSFLTETDYVNPIRAVIKDTNEEYQYEEYQYGQRRPHVANDKAKDKRTISKTDTHR